MNAENAAPEAAAWRHQAERSNRFWLRVMTLLSLRCGRRLSRLILPVIALYFAAFGGGARRAAQTYLARVGAPSGYVAVVRHFYAFAATIHDRVYLLNRRFELFDIEIDGEDCLRRFEKAGDGIFLFGAHLGSFEAIRAIGRGQRQMPVAMVMYEANARKINAALAAINPTASEDIIPLGTIDSMLRVRERLEAGYFVGVLADRGLGGDDYRPVPLLGAPASLPVGPWRMAALLRRPVLFMAGLYLGGNRYRLVFRQIADFAAIEAANRDAAIDAAMQAYVAEIERCCRIAPNNWFNFHDFWRSDAV